MEGKEKDRKEEGGKKSTTKGVREKHKGLMQSYKMELYHCKRCDHLWYPRKPLKPLICPHCKSPYWDREKVRA